MNNKKPVIIVGIIAVIFLGILIILQTKSTDNKAKQTVKNGPATELSQTEIANTVIIDNTDRLSAILLTEQYSAVYYTLVQYLQFMDKTNDHAVIVGETKVEKDSSVTFKVKTDKPDKTFSVILVRNYDTGKITLKIPDFDYETVIEVYKNSNY